MVANNVALEDLETALLAGVADNLGDEAAVRLLVAHGTWLTRPDFRQYIGHDDDSPGLAWVYFGGALDDEMPATASDHRILRLAAELAGWDTGVPLAELLARLDRHETFLVFDALAHALGLVRADLHL